MNAMQAQCAGMTPLVWRCERLVSAWASIDDTGATTVAPAFRN